MAGRSVFEGAALVGVAFTMLERADDCENVVLRLATAK
jgi:hypothetical protein